MKSFIHWKQNWSCQSRCQDSRYQTTRSSILSKYSSKCIKTLTFSLCIRLEGKRENKSKSKSQKLNMAKWAQRKSSWREWKSKLNFLAFFPVTFLNIKNMWIKRPSLKDQKIEAEIHKLFMKCRESSVENVEFFSWEGYENESEFWVILRNFEAIISC